MTTRLQTRSFGVAGKWNITHWLDGQQQGRTDAQQSPSFVVGNWEWSGWCVCHRKDATLRAQPPVNALKDEAIVETIIADRDTTNIKVLFRGIGRLTLGKEYLLEQVSHPAYKPLAEPGDSTADALAKT